ncbi:DUF423 domain-containing protein [Paenibacillus methanolicus]|uniref:Uncharacterized membrane protein YgdD (TMEM256/DUF423 family) n=1 Tax=Paenibacillus methanolicus TaxID=582686 RepID=A0A5S5BZU7_9BACL|nr:uncharacterized membrane protein YgdD (TMEM256/DUF423 family) [Paenibacillus methanolicus]
MLSKFGLYGAFHAGLAVILGAFGAHTLKERISEEMLTVFETGVRYHMYHALGLLVIGLLADRLGGEGKLRLAGRLMHLGIFLFSGSLYVLSLTEFNWVGPITPLGGVAFVAAWALVVVVLWKRRGQAK